MRKLAFFVVCALSVWSVEAPRPAQAQAAPEAMGQPAIDFQARRKSLMEMLRDKFKDTELPEGATPCLVLVRGASTGDREDFEEGRFRQSNDFGYLTGFELPGAFLVLNPNADKDTLYVPANLISNNPKGGFSHRATITEDALKQLGFAEIKDPSALMGDLFTAFADPMRSGRGGARGRCVVYTKQPSPAARDHSPNAEFIRYLKQGVPGTEFRDLDPLLADMRLIKTPAEIALLQRAIDITSQAERDVAAALKPGIFEFQVEAKLMHAFLDGGAMRPGFASIVGSGPNACIPHYFLNTRRIENNDLVVVDIGAEVQNYTADITRTFPANGKWSPRQRELYQAVLDAQTYAAEKVVPGKTRLGEMTGWVQEYLRKHPLRAKDASGNDQTLDRFFIHGLGHYLGLDVHDVGDYGKPLAPGMVFTIEPGLYIPYEDIGIRIEDDYLVTDKGLTKMSGNLPSTPDEIEAMMAKGKAASNTVNE